MRQAGRGAGVRLSAAAALAALLSAVPAAALDPAKAITQYRQRGWQVEHGLPQVSVQAIAQTADGYLWLGTQDGLARFDGVRFTVFHRRSTPGLMSNHVLALLADRAGGLWIGTSGGGLTHSSGGRFTAYTQEQGLPDNVILALHEDRRGRLWVGTAAGAAVRVEDGRFRTYTTREGLPDDTVLAIADDPQGGVWLGTNRGLARLAGERFTVYGRGDGLPSDQVLALRSDPSGGLWIGTAGGVARRLHEGRFAAITPADGLPNGVVLSLASDRDDNLWIGTNGGGLVRLAGKRLTAYSSAAGLPHDEVYALHEDREGNLWVGTLAGGLLRLSDTKLTTYTTREGLPSDLVGAVYEDPAGTLWVGSDNGGLSRLAGGRFSPVALGPGAGRKYIRALCGTRGGALWIGTNGSGLLRLEHGRVRAYTTRDGLPGNNVRAVIEDREGAVWVGTSRGLGRLQDGRFRRFSTADGLASNVILALLEDPRGGLWIGTWGGGLARFDGRAFAAYTTRQGLSNDVVLALHADREGDLWIGTNDGLDRLRAGVLESYAGVAGLPETVYRILDDGEGQLWLSGTRGITRVAKDGLNAFAAGTRAPVRARLFGASDGMRSPECNGGSQPAGWRRRDGTLWFPTLEGLVRIDPRSLRSNPLAPPVVVEDVRVDGAALPPGVFEAPPGRGDLEIRYTALSLVAPEAVRFRYRLEGHDEGWNEVGSRRVAYYTNLRPGRHRFHVTACNNDGVWNESGASLDLNLRPHYHQTAWFLSLCVAAVCGLAWQFHRLRLRALAATAAALEERHRIAQEIHDTIAQGLTGIGLRLDVAGRVLSSVQAEAARDHIDQAARLARANLGEARRLLGALRSPADALNLHEALVDVTDMLTAGTHVTPRVAVEGAADRLPGEVRWNLLRIAQEAVSNVVRHAGAQRLAVELICAPDEVRLRISDDGRGFSPRQTRAGGFGIVSMRRRAEALGGRLGVDSSPEAGTTVAVSVPARGRPSGSTAARVGRWLSARLRRRPSARDPRAQGPPAPAAERAAILMPPSRRVSR